MKIIGGIVIMIMLVLVGFKFVAAQGNEEKIREAARELQKRENISFGEAWERIIMVLESYGVRILSP